MAMGLSSFGTIFLGREKSPMPENPMPRSCHDYDGHFPPVTVAAVASTRVPYPSRRYHINFYLEIVYRSISVFQCLCSNCIKPDQRIPQQSSWPPLARVQTGIA